MRKTKGDLDAQQELIKYVLIMLIRIGLFLLAVGLVQKALSR